LTTTNANDLLFGFFHSDGSATNFAGPGFNGRTFSIDGYPLGEDKNVTVAGSYSATMNFSATADYVGFLVAFKAAASSGGGAPAYVGGNANACSATSCAVSLANTNAGDLIVLGLFVLDSTSVSSVADMQGNQYTPIGSPQTWSPFNFVERLYYAKNIKGGADTATVTLSGSKYMEVRLYEYSGLDTSAPLDAVATTQTSTSSTGVSGTVTTTNAHDLLFAFFQSDNSATNTAGPGFAARIFSIDGYPLGEDQNVTIAGSYSATMSFSSSADYVGLLVAFKAASGGTGGTQPTITSLNPTSGTVGAPITITGTNFAATQSTSTVKFNGTTASPTSWSATSITVPVPTGATTGSVIVTVGGVASNGVTFTVTSTAPNISSLSPAAGQVGTPVTITGINFGATQSTSTVTFNGTSGTPTSWSATSITVPVPAGATTGNVIVTVAGVASNGVNFTVTGPPPTITNLNPTSGAAGASVTITGTNFGATQSTSTVTFNGTFATPTSWSSTSITLPVPAGATTGPVVVTVSGVPSNGVSFTVIGPGAPVSDDFHGSTLNPMWNFFAPCCGFLKMSGTDALLLIPSVTTHDIYNVNFGVGLLQTVANVDFDVEVKFDSVVTQGDEVEGILVQQDTKNFIFVDVYHDGITPRLFAVATTNNTPHAAYNNPITIPPGTTSIWIRLNRTGTTWTQSWSVDGKAYNTAPPFTQSITVNAIGPAAGNDTGQNNSPAPTFIGAVDYFMNLASPISTDGGLPTPPNQPVFNVWYGDSQNFGQIGIPQKWVNILGNVTAPSGIASGSYTLNGGTSQFLRIGPNGTRLADTGDFNVEIDHALLNAGANTVVISATDNLGNTAMHTVTVNWQNTGQTWPLPYSINFATTAKISDVAQVVDGQWAIQPDGSVRTMQTAYDRTLAFGDVTWTDYQVTAQMTLNATDCFDFGTGLLVGWTGNTYGDSLALNPDQPTTGHPFFGIGEYSTNGGPPSGAALDIYANSTNHRESLLARDTSGLKLSIGVKYMLKFAVQRNANNTTSHYSLKCWPAGTAEPANWNIQADGDASTGSVMLAAFRTDVSYSNISVVALP
jgi:hypothetical protein